MIPIARSIRSILKAPVMTGALLFLCLSLVGCDERKSTPDWDQVAVSVVDVEVTQTASATRRDKTSAPGLRFMAYNVENWLTMERDGKEVGKPEKEKAAVVRLIVENRPDVLGVCEMGEQDEVDDLMARLKAAGWEMKHCAYDAQSHALRRLALLSRYPIAETSQPRVSEYRMNDRNWRMSRPILDATVDKEGCRYRFVGVHLKSKREVNVADQEQMRINEADLLRRHMDDILKSDPQIRLVAYGDFNDTRKSVAMKKVVGQYRTPTYLTAVPCGDSRGHRWTHHWDYQDVYSRFDYVLVSDGLKSEVDFQTSRVIDDPAWEVASDHRPLLTIFRATKSEN